MYSVLLLVAAAGLGQPYLGKPAERFEQVPFRGDLDAVLRQLLAGADEEEGLQKLLGQMRNHPQLDNDGLEWLNKLDLQNPSMRAQLRDLAAKMPGGKAPTLEQLQALRTSLEAQMRNMERLGGGVPIENLPPGFIPQPAPAAPNPAPANEDRLAQWTRDLFEEVDQTRVGDFLRESPAWQRAVLQLERTIRLPEAKLDWLGRLPDTWRLPEGLTNRLGNWSMGALPQVTLPNWSVSAPRFNLGLGGAPGLGAPTLGAPSIGSVSDGAFWVLAALLLGLLAFFFYRRLGHAAAPALAGRDLGPWPVDPARISTRRELVAAFDYLSRLLLGDEVLTWNHRAIAGRLSTAQPAAAQELAALYELARYAAGDDQPLPADHQTAARRAVQTVARFAPHAG